MSSKIAENSAKVVLIGEAGVGKTSIISRFIGGEFDPNCNASLGASYTSKVLNFPEYQQKVQFDIWDTAGQEKFRSLAQVLFKNAKIIVFVYDITNAQSFQAITDYWYNEIKNNILFPPIYAIAANKSDLFEKEEVDSDKAIEFAKSIDAIYKATSALDNKGIDTLFNFLGKKIIDRAFDYINDEKSVSISSGDFSMDHRTLNLSETSYIKNKKCC